MVFQPFKNHFLVAVWALNQSIRALFPMFQNQTLIYIFTAFTLFLACVFFISLILNSTNFAFNPGVMALGEKMFENFICFECFFAAL